MSGVVTNSNDRDWLEKRRSLQLVFKYWGALLLGEIDKGIDYLEEAVDYGTEVTDIHVTLSRVLPFSTVQEIEKQPRYQSLLARFAIDQNWRQELLEIAGDLAQHTGIEVQMDEEY